MGTLGGGVWEHFREGEGREHFREGEGMGCTGPYDGDGIMCKLQASAKGNSTLP